MSNLTKEQKLNLERDGYTIIERGGKTEIYKESPNGAVRYRMENGKVTNFDSYFGNERSKDDHDAFHENFKAGTIHGHGFEHKDKW